MIPPSSGWCTKTNSKCAHAYIGNDNAYTGNIKPICLFPVLLPVSCFVPLVYPGSRYVALELHLSGNCFLQIVLIGRCRESAKNILLKIYAQIIEKKSIICAFLFKFVT